MANNDGGQEKTLEPTPKKISDAKERGEFARSREITTVAILFAALLFFWLAKDWLLGRVLEAIRFFLVFDQFMNLTPSSTGNFFVLILVQMAPILMPLLLIVFFSALGAEMGQIGVRTVKDPFEPKWNKLNPVEGLKRIFSLRQLAEGIKSTIKVAIFGIMGYLVVKRNLPQLMELLDSSPLDGLDLMFDIALGLGFRCCGLLVLFAGFDYWFQRWQYLKKLRMTHQEMKEEIKEQQGDPILKARMRSIQMEIARRRMMRDVANSEVVVTNPTHYAVALRYDPEENSAPTLVAKGQNYLALKIREVAEEAGVPIVENPPLARALYRQVEIGHAIPAALFRAVAQILASVWLLSKNRGRTWTRGKSDTSGQGENVKAISRNGMKRRRQALA